MHPGHRVFVGLSGIRVGGQAHRLADLDAAEVGLVDVGAEPDVLQVADGHHRRAGRDVLTGLDVFGEDNARKRSSERGITKARLGEAEGGLGLLDAGAGLFDGLRTRPLLKQRVALLRFFQRCAGLGDLLLARPFLDQLELFFRLVLACQRPFVFRLGAVVLALGDGVVLEELRVTVELHLEMFGVHPGARDAGLRGRDLLRPRTGQQLVETGLCAFDDGLRLGDLFGPETRLKLRKGRLGGAQFRLSQGDLLREVGVVQPGDDLAGLHQLAFGGEALPDLAADLEADLGVGNLDIARHPNCVRVAVGPVAQIPDGQDGRDDDERRDQHKSFLLASHRTASKVNAHSHSG